jgi:hypothetical protein
LCMVEVGAIVPAWSNFLIIRRIHRSLMHTVVLYAESVSFGKCEKKTSGLEVTRTFPPV